MGAMIGIIKLNEIGKHWIKIKKRVTASVTNMKWGRARLEKETLKVGYVIWRIGQRLKQK
jgi:hypothetical protein